MKKVNKKSGVAVRVYWINRPRLEQALQELKCVEAIIESMLKDKKNAYPSSQIRIGVRG